MKKLIHFLLLLTAATAIHAQSQLHVFEDWTGTAGTQNFFYKNVTKTDGSGNVYVAGATVNGSGSTDILVAKYSSGGNLLWTQQYNGLADYYDFATALMTDASNNVYVTGAVSNDTLNPTTNTDVILIKYNSSGVQQWVSTYAGPAGYFDAGTDLYVTSGGVALIGSSMNSSFNMDYVTILYNSAGVQQWATVYDHSSHLNDVPVKISRKGNSVLVGGAVQTGAGSYDWAVIQYNASGVQTAFTSSTGGSPAIDSVFDMMEDASGNIYIAGSTLTPTHGYDYDLVKLDSNLVIQWEKTYDGADHLDDVIRSVKADAAGNVYVTGVTTTTQGLNYLTQKYNSAGTLVWSQAYNDSLNGDDEAHALVLDNAETSLYVTGFSYTDSLNGINYYTIKYDSAGTQKWAIPFDGNKHLRDKATNIAIDTSGNVIVTGESEISAGMYEYATVRYVEKQTIVPTDFNSEPTPASFLYYANKGQLISTDSTLVPDVRFYTNSTYPAYYFKDDTLSMVFSSIDTIAATDDTLHRIDLSFPSCNEHLRIYPLDEQSGYLNYFLGHCPQGVTEIHGQQRLVIHDLYDHIDLVYSSNQNGMKYYFIVKPGGDPDDIHFKYTGASSTSLSSNNLTINSLAGSITLDRPFTYQLNSSNDTIANSDVYADWHSNGSNDYDFDLHPFDSTKVLVIEVDEGNGILTTSSTGNLEHSTFYGGHNGDTFRDIVTDNTGNAYASGTALSVDFPIVHGVIQDTLRANSDMVVVKFNGSNLNNTWATYYGGSSDEAGNAIEVDANKEVYVGGITYSSDIPILNSLTSGGHSFLFKLNASGTARNWATYFGEIGTYIYDIALDHIGNLYAVGTVPSPSSITFPQTGTTTYTTGNGFILKISTNGIQKWTSLFGNQFYCKIYGVACDQSNNVFLTGSSRLTGFVQTNPNFTHAYQSTGSEVDAFITKLDAANNNIVWSSWYGGNHNEQGERIAINSHGDVAVVGSTASNLNFPSLNYPTGGNTYGGDDGTLAGLTYGDGFIAVFDNSGHHLFGTYYGKATNDACYGVCYDSDDQLYVSGWTTSSTNSFLIPSSNAAGAYAVNSLLGSSDAFIACFNTSYHQIWGTYFGGSHSETGYAVSVFQNQKLYLAGLTQSAGVSTGFTPFPLEDYIPGVSYYQNKLNLDNTGISSKADGFMARFDLAPIAVIGIDEIQNSNSELVVYPNPNSGIFNLSLHNINGRQKIRVNIYDITGKIIYQSFNENSSDVMNKVLDLSYLSNGIYLLQVQIEDRLLSKKIIKN